MLKVTFSQLLVHWDQCTEFVEVGMAEYNLLGDTKRLAGPLRAKLTSVDSNLVVRPNALGTNGISRAYRELQ